MTRVGFEFPPKRMKRLKRDSTKKSKGQTWERDFEITSPRGIKNREFFIDELD